jgi:hypothetical protein
VIKCLQFIARLLSDQVIIVSKHTKSLTSVTTGKKIMLHPTIQKSIAVLATTIFSVATSTTLTVAAPLESISYQKTNLSTSQGGSIANLVALIKKTKKSTPAKNNQIKVVYRETKSEDLMTKFVFRIKPLICSY